MTKLYPFQRDDILTIECFGGKALIASDMGLGKTLEALTWADWFLGDGPVVVVCPASVKWHWQREAWQHVGMKFTVLSGTRAYRLKGGPKSGHVLNYDILGGWLRELKRIGPRLVVLDEAHFCAGRRTKRTKNCRNLCRNVPHVLALTGTPFLNRPAEIWPTLNMLRPDLFGAWLPFGIRYCKPSLGYAGIVQYNGASRTKELSEILKRELMVRRRTEDVLTQLPPKTRQVELIDLDDADEYAEARDKFLKWLQRTRPNKVHKARRAEGLVKIGYLLRLGGELKVRGLIQWVTDFLASGGGKLIFFGVHKKVLLPLFEKNRKWATIVTGAVTGKGRQAAFDRFTLEPGCRLFVGNVKAAGAGWNGTAAQDVAFGELPWNPGLLLQAEKRPHRIGQNLPVRVHYLLGKDTLEPELVKLHHRKEKIFRAVLDGGRAGDKFDLFEKLEEALLKEKS